MAYPHQVPSKLSKYFEDHNSIRKTSHNSCPKDFDDASMKTSYMGNKKNFGACPSKQRSIDQDKQFRNKKITIKYFLKPRKNMCTHLKHAKTQNYEYCDIDGHTMETCWKLHPHFHPKTKNKDKANNDHSKLKVKKLNLI
jgi:hypothetical protein